MKIGIIGSGYIGGNLARLLVKAGHEVALANSRGPASLQHFADELGKHLHPMEAIDAVTFGDVVIVAFHWRNLDHMPVYDMTGKIVIDTTNPYKADGTFYDLGGDIPSTKVLEHFRGGKLVKAFNAIWYKHLAELGNTTVPVDERRVIPLAGDNADAKKIVGSLIEDVGFAPLDTGSLLEGSKLQGVDGILFGTELPLKEAKMLMS
ncbi:MAG: NAD(P)-binding domain-containing protein [Chitinophagaceae bacterium]